MKLPIAPILFAFENFFLKLPEFIKCIFKELLIFKSAMIFKISKSSSLFVEKKQTFSSLGF